MMEKDEDEVGDWMHPIKVLEGKIVEKIYINADHTIIHFKIVGNGIIGFEAHGECCSTSWIQHMSGVDTLIGQPVISVEAIDLSCMNFVSKYNDYDDNDDTDVRESGHIEVYGYKFKTLKGYCDMEYRNSSNGYYGGSIELIEKYDSPLAEPMNELTEDF